ncbi:MAG: hypothetical protein HYS38_06745 [Acidobacteria bacterium]|nr:hypothetical protein [Acidobacteriota bacterium]
MLELILLFVFCVVGGLACLGAMGWALLSSVEVGVEKIFLLIVSLLSAALFFGMAAWIALRSSLWQLWKGEAKGAAPETSIAPAQKQEAAAQEEVHKSGS